MATLQSEGKTLVDKDELMLGVMNGSTVLMFSFRSHVGSESSEQDLLGSEDISLRTCSAVTGWKPDSSLIGGDSRADSPGHAVNNGSYTTIELTINKIVDIQLVVSTFRKCVCILHRIFLALGLSKII